MTEPITYDEYVAATSDGECRGMDHRIFFPERGGNTDLPKSICAVCPCSDPCLEWALYHHEDYGIFGGTSGKQRRVIRRVRGIVSTAPQADSELTATWHHNHEARDRQVRRKTDQRRQQRAKVRLEAAS